MKKLTSVILCLIICTSSLAALANGVDAVSLCADMSSELYEGELAKISCHITGAWAGAAKLELYIDGVLESSACKDITLGSNLTETIEFTVPQGLDKAYLHTALVALKYNGNEKYTPCIFSLLPDAKLGAKFFSTPLCVTPNYELYYGVEFSAPEGRRFVVNTRASANGVGLEESTKALTITNGYRDIVRVAAEIVGSDAQNFDMVYEVSTAHGAEKITLSSKYEELKKIIKPVIIPATIRYTTNGYSTTSLKTVTASVQKGTEVEYLNPDNHNSMSAAKIKLPSGFVCWVPMSAVSISNKNFTIADTLSDREKEIFVNNRGYASDTYYLVWVSKERQRVYVFLGNKGNWKLCATFPAATGKNRTPTPTVVCRYEYKTRWVTDEYICDPVLALYDGYALHNQPVSHSGNVIDTTIGNPASAGCIRLLKEHADWLYAYVPVGTTVVLY